jgi:N-acetylmuramic acid 6-phosphate etherase
MSESLPPTELRQERSAGLDLLETRELVEVIVRDQEEAIAAVSARTNEIARVVDGIASRLARGGRLHYIGAGTSGRLGVLDASEMPPTFGTPPDLVCAHIAGGDRALRNAIEGAEDDALAGAAEMRGHVGPHDAVIGISASGGAPYVVGALEVAREAGALTVAITSSESSALTRVAEEAIALATGPEVLTGSTRLKAGTAQKVTLNAISTAVMVRLGKVYDNLMIDVVATNAKLRARAVRLVRTLTGADEERAQEALAAGDGSVKVAVVMLVRGVGAREARALLDDVSTLRSLL